MSVNFSIFLYLLSIHISKFFLSFLKKYGFELMNSKSPFNQMFFPSYFGSVARFKLIWLRSLNGQFISRNVSALFTPSNSELFMNN